MRKQRPRDVKMLVKAKQAERGPEFKSRMLLLMSCHRHCFFRTRPPKQNLAGVQQGVGHKIWWFLGLKQVVIPSPL